MHESTVLTFIHTTRTLTRTHTCAHFTARTSTLKRIKLQFDLRTKISHSRVKRNAQKGSGGWWNNHWEPSLLREWTISTGPIHSAAFYSTQEIKYLPKVGLLKSHDIFKGPTVHLWHQPNTYPLIQEKKNTVSFVQRCKRAPESFKRVVCLYISAELSISQHWYFKFCSSTFIF